MIEALWNTPLQPLTVSSTDITCLLVLGASPICGSECVSLLIPLQVSAPQRYGNTTQRRCGYWTVETKHNGAKTVKYHACERKNKTLCSTCNFDAHRCSILRFSLLDGRIGRPSGRWFCFEHLILMAATKTLLLCCAVVGTVTFETTLGFESDFKRRIRRILWSFERQQWQCAVKSKVRDFSKELKFEGTGEGLISKSKLVSSFHAASIAFIFFNQNISLGVWSGFLDTLVHFWHGISKLLKFSIPSRKYHLRYRLYYKLIIHGTII